MSLFGKHKAKITLACCKSHQYDGFSYNFTKLSFVFLNVPYPAT